ncbi:S-adenosyl-L-methionine-dependent methyltransferase [Syncephalis plumigaleata]|nr:S-adenosyl-L-methionine-dependent methyltransferase [Syncephalis plumigaleata]
MDSYPDSEYTYLNGRRYINAPNIPYMLPVDFHEMDRQVLQSVLLDMVTGSLYNAPIQHPKTILDVGSGNCSWMMKMAAQFPHSQLIGIDLLPPSPDTVLPSNCHLKIGNIIKPKMPFVEDSFDFVHHRQLGMAIPSEKWPDYIGNCVEITKPGGWIEMSEIKIPFNNSGPIGQQINRLWERFTKVHKVDLRINERLGHLMTQAGLEDVSCEVYQIPIGEWGGQLGKLAWADYYHAISAVAPHMAKCNDVSLDSINMLVEAVREEANMNQYCCEFHCHYGRKPSLTSSASSW